MTSTIQVVLRVQFSTNPDWKILLCFRYVNYLTPIWLYRITVDRFLTKSYFSCLECDDATRTMTAFSSVNGLENVSYPRTGKRGVPQQFPRRLHLMLESEAKLQATSSDHPDIISWSDSGKAFKISDVSKFSSEVLPKYFRTSKFSSFQRNLNLVSFIRLFQIVCNCTS